MKLAWATLATAILLELGGFVCLKLSKGFSAPLPCCGVVVCYSGSFLLLARALKHLDASIAYATWAGAGTCGIAVLGFALLGEPLSSLKAIGVLLVVVGIVLLNLAGGGH